MELIGDQLFVIVNYLNISDVRILSYVCKKIYRIIRQAPLKHRIIITSYGEAIEILSNYNFHKFTLYGPNIDDDTAMLFSLYDNIHFNRCHNVTDKTIDKLRNHKKVYFEKCNGFTDNSISQLQCLEICMIDCQSITGVCLSSICTRIEKIDLSFNKRISQSYLGLLHNCQTVIMDYCEQLQDKHLEAFTKCKKVSLKFCYKITDNGLRYLKNSTHIDLSGCSGITDFGLSFLEKCTYLSVRLCSQLSDEGMYYLQKCKFVDLFKCYQITDNGIKFLYNCMTINLAGCIRLTDRCLLSNINWRKVIIDRTNKFTSEKLSEMKFDTVKLFCD